MQILEFLRDQEYTEAFITGSAGTGKTTMLSSILNTLRENKIGYQVTAYTNIAVDILREATGEQDSISTLHSFLKKRPTVNSKAQNKNHIMVSRQYGEPVPVELLIVDEFSFIGENDYMDIGDLSSICMVCGEYLPCNCKEPKVLKVLYIGDSNQLNPVGSYQAVVPHGKYWTKLTKVYRQDKEDINLIKLKEAIESEDINSYVPIDSELVTIIDDITKEYENEN